MAAQFQPNADKFNAQLRKWIASHKNATPDGVFAAATMLCGMFLDPAVTDVYKFGDRAVQAAKRKWAGHPSRMAILETSNTCYLLGLYDGADAIFSQFIEDYKHADDDDSAILCRANFVRHTALAWNPRVADLNRYSLAKDHPRVYEEVKAVCARVKARKTDPVAKALVRASDKLADLHDEEDDDDSNVAFNDDMQVRLGVRGSYLSDLALVVSDATFLIVYFGCVSAACDNIEQLGEDECLPGSCAWLRDISESMYAWRVTKLCSPHGDAARAEAAFRAFTASADDIDEPVHEKRDNISVAERELQSEASRRYHALQQVAFDCVVRRDIKAILPQAVVDEGPVTRAQVAYLYTNNSKMMDVVNLCGRRGFLFTGSNLSHVADQMHGKDRVCLTTVQASKNPGPKTSRTA